MKNLFLSMILMALPILVSAYDVEVDGIYYNLDKVRKTAEVTYKEKMELSYSSDYSKTVVIPEKITCDEVEYSVTSIGDHAFYYCGGLKSLTIPNTITIIGDWAFEYCSGLHSLIIPNSVTSIGRYAFEWCTGLTSFNIPSSITTIKEYAFHNCYGLISINIPSSVINIDACAFANCRGLTSVTIPNSVINIDACAFANCNVLSAVNISDLEAWCNINFGQWDANPLYNAKHLYLNGEEIKDLVIPNSVTRLKKYAFVCCTGLSSVTIPNSLTEIGYLAFGWCSGLTSAYFGNSLTRIEGGAFFGCSNLTSLNFPNSLTSIESNSIWGTFASCTSIVSITIPNSVTNIGDCTFDYCTSLTTVSIPNSITHIGYGAFRSCSNLEKVFCYAEQIPETDTNAFVNSYPAKATLYVPAESINAYKTSIPWSEFGAIKAIEEITKKCATPTISYSNKKLTFSCATDGAQCLYTITDSDIKTDLANEVSLTATYNISVYATKSGYTNSDVATATLVWTDAIFTVTTPETPTSAKAVQESIPVLISAKGGNISVKCEADGQEVNVYTIDGLSLGTATVKNGEALISTSIQSGDIAVVKVGGRSVKVIMR